MEAAIAERLDRMIELLESERPRRGLDVRGLATPPAPIERVQVFGQWADVAGVINPVVQRSSHWAASWTNKDAMCGAARLWHIRSNAQEVTRVPPAVPASPLNFGQITGESGFPLPAGVGATRQPKSKLKLALILDTAAGQEVYFGDLGQPIEVYALGVTVRWVGPANFVEVTGFNGDGAALMRGVIVPQQDGLLVDAVIGVTIEGIEESVGHGEWTFTEPLQVAATVQGQIAVPRGAVNVQVTQTTGGAASVQWRQFAADPAAGGREIGVLPFLAGQRRSSDNATLLSDAVLLVTDVDAVAGRTFSVVWTIRP